MQNTNASGILNFYDGIITGATKQSTSGTINDIEAGYDIIVIDNGDYTESAVLRKEVIAKVLKNSIKTSELNSVEYSEDGDYYTFYKIEDAVNLCIDNKKANIIIVRDLNILMELIWKLFQMEKI